MKVRLMLGLALFSLCAESATNAQLDINVPATKQILNGRDDEAITSALRNITVEIQRQNQISASKGEPKEGIRVSQSILAPLSREIAELATHDAPEIRVLVARLLGYAPSGAETTQSLLRLAKDDVPDIRYAALGSIFLADDRTDETQTTIVDLLEDPTNSSQFRDAAAIAVEWRIPHAVAPLRAALKSENSHIKAYAATALSDLGAKEALNDITDQIDSVSDPALRAQLQSAKEKLEALAETPPPVPPSPSDPPQRTIPKTPSAEQELSKAPSPTETPTEDKGANENTLIYVVLAVIATGFVCALALRKARKR